MIDHFGASLKTFHFILHSIVFKLTYFCLLWGRAMQGFGRQATASRPYYPSRG